MPPVVIDTTEDRISPSSHSPTLSSLLSDLAEIIAASSDDPQELVSSNENPMHQALVFREAHEIDRIFGDALSRDHPLSKCLHEEAIMGFHGLPFSKHGINLCPWVYNVFTLDRGSLPVTSVDTDKAEVVHVDPRDSVEKKGRAKPGTHARQRKREVVPPFKENKDDGKENVPEIHEEPTKDSLRWIRDLPPMKSPLASANTKRSQAKEDRAKPDERPSTPLPNDKVEWMEKIMETAYCNIVPPKPYKPKPN
ncbi:uncharacterized protein EV420DRAFT_1638126 [Desarmillaria tabescens]|uniref:Uncharacterized protein n=1 Tax=Armillaria tabescens TaxID=1929756 RepID=A0AA39T4Q1_ARMTA|nr:uncharacterized protein EV420DRAFT_1638126 [Desarmillaria tabescens]KAK0464576.1 hypothetical protein EV420DRAFT_1638126 [Desarmillaria tabescens]